MNFLKGIEDEEEPSCLILSDLSASLIEIESRQQVKKQQQQNTPRALLSPLSFSPSSTTLLKKAPTAVDSIVKEQQQQLHTKNMFAILNSLVRYMMNAKRITNPELEEVLTLFETIGPDPELSDIVLQFHQDKVDRVFACLKRELLPHLHRHGERLLRQYQSNLFPSLVGSTDVPYTEEAFKKRVDILAAIVDRYRRKEAMLKIKCAKRDAAITKLADLTEQCYSHQITNDAKLDAEERLAKLELLKTKMKYQSQIKEEQQEKVFSPNSGRELTDSDEAYAALVIRNKELEEEVNQLERKERLVDSLDPIAVANYRRAAEQYDFAVKMASASTSTKGPRPCPIGLDAVDQKPPLLPQMESTLFYSASSLQTQTETIATSTFSHSNISFSFECSTTP